MLQVAWVVGLVGIDEDEVERLAPFPLKRLQAGQGFACAQLDACLDAGFTPVAPGNGVVIPARSRQTTRPSSGSASAITRALYPV